MEQVTGFSKILVALDGSENSFRAYKVAVVLAEKFKAWLAVLYVIPPGNIHASPLTDEFEAQLERDGRKQIEKATSLAVKERVRVLGKIGLREMHRIT